MSDIIITGGAVAHPIAQIIELATAHFPTQHQLDGWGAYQQAGGSLQSIADAFVASTAFANQYNNGALVDPNSTINFSIAQGIIAHALGAHSIPQVNAWVDSGLTVGQVFLAFAVGDQFTAAEGLQNSAIQIVGIPPQNSTFTGELTGATTSGGTSTAAIGIPSIGGVSAGDHLVFNNAATEALASTTGEVNVDAALSLAQALDMSAADASASQGGGLVPANTGVIDWFLYGGNTYVVEAINPTSISETQSALTATDAVVEIVGLSDLSGAQFAGHTLTI